MRKRLAIFTALLLLLTAMLPVIAACNTEKAVTNLKFVDPKTSYTVGDTIDYDNLNVEITYEDQSKETKTVKALKALGATLTEADLSKSGNTFYSLSYKKATARVDISVSAKNVEVKDEVTVVLNFHDNKTNPVTITLERNTALGDKLPANPTREGYTFDGWFTEETGGTKWDASAPVQGNVLNLHAHWTRVIVEVDVILNLNYEGAAAPTKKTVEKGSTVTASELGVPAAREGYRFDGWYTLAEGGDKWTEGVVNAETTLYAHWVQQFRVTFSLGYDTEAQAPAALTVDIGSKLTSAQLAAPANREGYSFDGWFKADGNKWNEAEDTVTGDITLTAHWTEITVKVTVSFYLGIEAEESTYDTMDVEQDHALSAFPAQPTREGYDFVGWFTQKEGGTEWTLTTPVTEDVDLYAHWTLKSFTVNYNYNGGSGEKTTETAIWNTTVTLPTPNHRLHYRFDGWKLGDKIYQAGEEVTITDNVTFVAQWTEATEYVKVTLVFHDDKTDNRELNVIKQTALGALLPSDITRTNYEFLGWFTAETGGTEWESDMLVNESITLHAHWHQTVVPPTVTRFAVPTEYQNYVDASKPLTGEEGEGDFRVRGEAYEVGTVNRFVFNPIFEVMENGKPTEKDNPTTIAKVYTKANAEGAYTELVGADKDAFVTKIGNTYRFSKEAKGGTYVKLEISLDTQSYDVPSSINNLLTVEFVLVEGGYNVYNQLGLSVMADLQKMAWSEIWKCTTRVEGNSVICVADANSLQLPWDDDFLCNYVDKVSTVIIHRTVTLDPDQMPSLYFWTDTPNTLTSDLYTEAWNTIKDFAPFSTGEDTLVGTLRGGDNSAKEDDRNYMRNIDANPSGQATSGDYQVYGQQSIETGIWLNMQKGLFATKKVSVSGNYQSLLTPLKGERSKTYNRLLEVYVDWNKTAEEAPDSVYSVFHMLQSQREGADVETFAIKNLAMRGNNPKANTEGFSSAGLMILDSYNMTQAYYNVNASQFCRMMSADDYGVLKRDANGKVTWASDAQPLDATVYFEGVKFYDAYSNMFSMWRSTVDIKNSEMIGSGGPLFIMNDGDRNVSQNPTNTDDTGCELTVDDTSVLQAYAIGNESWYAIWKAAPLFSSIGSNVEPVMNALGKTLKTVKNGNGYYNVIAAMICTPGKLFDGGGVTNSSELIDVRGVYKQYGETFAMHNAFLVQFRQAVLNAGGDARMFAPIIQSGNNIFALTGSLQVGENTIPKIQRMDGSSSTMSSDPSEVMQIFGAEQAAWASNNSRLACIYMSAGAFGAQWAPYFAIVLELNAKA